MAILRRERPHVVVTYPDVQDGYAHPDHLRVHDVTIAAVRVAADPAALSWAGPAWDVPKLYYTMWSRPGWSATHEKLLELGLESPWEASWFRRPWQDFRVTTRIDVAHHLPAQEGGAAGRTPPRSTRRRRSGSPCPTTSPTPSHPWEEYHLAQLDGGGAASPRTTCSPGCGRPRAAHR